MILFYPSRGYIVEQRVRFESRMTWEAANATKSKRERRTDDEGKQDPYGISSPPPQPKRRATETVEAALSRLSKTYITSMECIRALTKSDHVLSKQDDVSAENLNVLIRVAEAARSTLEGSILVDPLIVQHAPTLQGAMQALASAGNEKWIEMLHEKRHLPPQLSSQAHKTSVREFAYLSLVNYADLLMTCCLCEDCASNNDSILDRGVVKKLNVLANHRTTRRCCWNDESQESTQRLALTALCDASKLDGSDPTMWLKLSCAARGLERIISVKNRPSLASLSKFRRLQRYALERGIQALPPTLPPNRAITQALKELDGQMLPSEYPPTLAREPERVELVLELPRYSWGMLGRMLMRACREGCDYQPDVKTTTMIACTNQARKTLFGSPAIVLKLSPMLVLPSRVLGRICKFLESETIWRFEATCRALSVSIISARASMEKEGFEKKAGVSGTDKTKTSNPTEGSSTTKASNPGEGDKPATISIPNKDNSERNDTAPAAPKDEADEYSRKSKQELQNERKKEEKQEKQCTSHRTSKRLLSQLITSGKIADRKSKQNSVDFCFLAATLACTKDDLRSKIKAIMEGDKTVSRLLQGVDLFSKPEFQVSSRIPLNDTADRHKSEARERVGDSSLSAFAEKWSCRNSGPMDLLLRYLGHIALSVEDVFSSDPGGSMVLTSCVLGCKYCADGYGQTRPLSHICM